MAGGGDLIPLVCGCCFSSIFIFGFAIFIAVLVYSFKAMGRYRKVLEEFAAEIGCRFEKGGALKEPTVSGVYRGRKVELFAYTQTKHHGSGVDKENYSVTYTRASAYHGRALPQPITILRKGPLTWGSGIAGVKKAGISPGFDEKYETQTADESAAKEIIDVDVQQKMLSISIYLRRIFISGDTVACEASAHVSDKQKLRQLLDLSVDIADRLENKR